MANRKKEINVKTENQKEPPPNTKTKVVALKDKVCNRK